jgi:hypothetical protein
VLLRRRIQTDAMNPASPAPSCEPGRRHLQFEAPRSMCRVWIIVVCLTFSSVVASQDSPQKRDNAQTDAVKQAFNKHECSKFPDRPPPKRGPSPADEQLWEDVVGMS